MNFNLFIFKKISLKQKVEDLNNKNKFFNLDLCNFFGEESDFTK